MKYISMLYRIWKIPFGAEAPKGILYTILYTVYNILILRIPRLA